MKKKIEMIKKFIATSKKQNIEMAKELKKGLTKYKSSRARQFIEMNELYIAKLESII